MEESNKFLIMNKCYFGWALDFNEKFETRKTQIFYENHGRFVSRDLVLKKQKALNSSMSVETSGEISKLEQSYCEFVKKEKKAKKAGKVKSQTDKNGSQT